MSVKASRNVLLLIASSIIAFIFSTTAFATLNSVNLYDQPKSDAKVIGTVDVTAGVVPIFSSPQGDWMKVGDPRNGNVGWVKSSDLNSNGGSTSFTFTQKMINNGKGPQTYQMIQYGSPQKLTPEQTKALQQLELQQQHFQKEWQDMMDMFNHDFSHETFMPGMNFPMIMPVVVVPVQQHSQTQPKSAQTVQTVQKPKQ